MAVDALINTIVAGWDWKDESCAMKVALSVGETLRDEIEMAHWIERAFENGALAQHAAGVSRVQRVPWMINEFMVPVVEKLVRSAAAPPSSVMNSRRFN